MKPVQKMKAFILTTLLVSGALFFTGCSKETVIPKSEHEKLFDYLTSELGNKKWFLKAIYVNGALQPLTDAQKRYYKTYTRTQSPFTATFLDDDGNRGEAYLLSVIQLKEVINNGPTGAATRDYVVKELSEKTMDIQITNPPGVPAQIVREVYYAN
ncbi:MAG: hypothetical protein RLZZ429_690 [Bacteroidota bacterium]|jgi:hypothetical protein